MFIFHLNDFFSFSLVLVSGIKERQLSVFLKKHSLFFQKRRKTQKFSEEDEPRFQENEM